MRMLGVCCSNEVRAKDSAYFEIRQMNLSAPKLYGAEKESAKAAEESGERMLEILETSSSPSGTAARNVAFR